MVGVMPGRPERKLDGAACVLLYRSRSSNMGPENFMSCAVLCSLLRMPKRIFFRKPDFRLTSKSSCAHFSLSVSGYCRRLPQLVRLPVLPEGCKSPLVAKVELGAVG